MLGTSGRNGGREAVVTASARTVPAASCPTDSGPLLKDIGICPPRRSLMAGAPPLYGIPLMSNLARPFRSSPARCVEVPIPAWAKARLPGFERACATTSPTVLKGESARTSRKFGEDANSEIGVKSLKVSYGSLGYRNGLVAWPLATTMRV